MLKRILGTVLTAMVVVLMAIPLAIASDVYPNYPSVAQEKLKEKRQEERDQKKDAKQDASQDAAKEAGQRAGAEADTKMREQVKTRKRGVAKQSHKANQDYLEKVRTGQVAKPAELGNPNYCVSRAVKLDRRRVFTDSELRHYVRDGHNEKEAFWVTERDGAMMLVDPLISQNLR